MLKKINKMKLDSTVASFTQQRNQVVFVMKPKRSVREFSWKACFTCPKQTVSLFSLVDCVARAFDQLVITRHLYLNFQSLIRRRSFSTTRVHLSSMAFTNLHVKYDIRLNNRTLRCRAEKTVILTFVTNYQCQKRKVHKNHLLLFESRKNKIVQCQN